MTEFRRNSSSRRKTVLNTSKAGFALLLAFGPVGHAAPALDDKVLAGPCVNCHGPDGRSPGAIPSIAGLPEAELKAKLVEYKSDAPPAHSTAGTTIMNRLAKGYTDDQIAVLAHYYAQMKPAAGAGTGAKP